MTRKLIAYLLGCIAGTLLIAAATFHAYGQEAAKPAASSSSGKAVAEAPAPTPPQISAEIELAFVSADRDLANARLQMAALEQKREAAAKALFAACAAPWTLALDQKTGRFSCTEAPKDAPAAKK